jgi:starch synthase
MKILMIASECVPFVKTGGLGDAVSSLSLALAGLGHDVRVVIPRYYSVNRDKLEHLEGEMGVPVGGGEEWCAVYKTSMPASSKDNAVEVYFIDFEKYFGRDGIYGTPWEPDFLDNPRRFTFLCKAAFQLCRKIHWEPDVMHAHDWQAAVVPVLLKFAERHDEFAKTISILTIHNLGYQGVYAKSNYEYLGLGWDVFYKAGFEDWDMLNFLKAGIYSADRLNTVSKTYRNETLQQAQGFRLDGPLRYRQTDYRGILNGIDDKVWNPKIDRYLPRQYDADNLAGKAACKSRLQMEFGLEDNPDIPIIGMVTRLVGQKGVGELFGPGYGSAWSICHDMAVQFIVLGTGDGWCEGEIRSLQNKLPNFRGRIGYSENVSHLIEAGADFFLMPSRYEPCGLNQMYSLMYGTPPIVRATGGLVDTVQNFNQDTGEGTGFMFGDLTPRAIYDTVGWAVWTYYNKKDLLTQMRRRGMRQDFSWKKSAQEYISMYENALQNDT